ncbi:IS21 family transposase [Paraflavisolibacter sp. H34]|uniref:IS21 family transposase n=1 Tax=Huijunlia imazamoxiresistens TaxID=3127457 RepID=UPI00301885BB
MEQLKQILQLQNDGFSIKAIARHTGLARNTVKKYLARTANTDTEPSTPADDNQLASIAYNDDTTTFKSERYTSLLQHFCYAETEVKKVGVTRQLLWQEYKEQHPDGYNYSQYCFRFSEYLQQKEVVMHLEHRAGLTIMVDFAGKKLSYTDAQSREIIPCQVFVSVLPHSGLVFCKAVHTQNTYDFIDCINSMLTFYGGAAQTILCDNLKTAVVRPSRYEPLFTDMCYQLSEHFATTFSAARPYKPRDKAMVERCVSIVYTHIYAPLRNEVFTSLGELNAAMALQLQKLNDKAYKGSSYSRRHLFEQYEQPVLKELPAAAFELKRCTMATVQRNYHIQLPEDRNYYSIPFTYVGKKVKVLFDNKTVEVYYEHSRIAFHRRSHTLKGYNTQPDHMPSSHRHAQQVMGWTSEELLEKARKVGTHTHQVVGHILTASFFPEQNYKSCIGVLMLENAFGQQRLEAACARALTGTRINYTMIKNILECGLDRQPLVLEAAPLPLHENIRGAEHYY